MLAVGTAYVYADLQRQLMRTVSMIGEIGLHHHHGRADPAAASEVTK
jgi:hypothetical protein